MLRCSLRYATLGNRLSNTNVDTTDNTESNNLSIMMARCGPDSIFLCLISRLTSRMNEARSRMAKVGMKTIRKKCTARGTRLVPFTKVVTTTVPVHVLTFPTPYKFQNRGGQINLEESRAGLWTFVVHPLDVVPSKRHQLPGPRLSRLQHNMRSYIVPPIAIANNSVFVNVLGRPG